MKRLKPLEVFDIRSRQFLKKNGIGYKLTGNDPATEMPSDGCGESETL